MNARPARADNDVVETFAAELTAAVYSVALWHGPGERWLELELGLWNAVANTLDKWRPEFSGAAVQGQAEPNPS